MEVVVNKGVGGEQVLDPMRRFEYFNFGSCRHAGRYEFSARSLKYPLYRRSALGSG
jgi:hypothetical protein